MSNYLVNQIYKSRKYILEILEERGFDISDYNNFTIDELYSMIQNSQLDLILSNSEEKKIYIKYNITKALRPNNVYDIVEDLFNVENILDKKDDLIIINKDEPNDTLNSVVKNIWLKDNIYISIINIARLQFNILKHELVPKHIILTDEEKTEVKKKYNIDNDNMIPNISYFSPVALVLGMRPGNICKIERFSKTAIYSEFYRICIL
jgi:DNA-directed RNA polymerase subunit H (RpoH/RPB5)